MPETHAKLSASGAKKWINCPLSVKMESEIPDKESTYAAEGTTAHALSEAKLKLATKQLTRVQYHKAIKDLNITEDMEEYTDAYRDFVIERLNAAKALTPDAELKIEQRLDFSDWVPGGFGTGDAVIISDGTVEVIDLKYGQGIRVSAQDNPQLRLYGLGALAAYDFLYDIDTITMTIFQPRLDHCDSETLALKELKDWGEYIREKATLADSGEGECVAGKHCDEGFCKARAICRAYANEKLRLAPMDFKPPAQLTNDEIAEIIDQSEKLANWAKTVKDYALEQALNGEKYPGFKIVEGRSNRKYSKSDEEIGSILENAGYREDDIYTKNILGISKMESFLSKKTFKEVLGDYIIKPQGKPTLVPVEDSRPEWNSADEDFKNVK